MAPNPINSQGLVTSMAPNPRNSPGPLRVSEVGPHLVDWRAAAAATKTPPQGGFGVAAAPQPRGGGSSP